MTPSDGPSAGGPGGGDRRAVPDPDDPPWARRPDDGDAEGGDGSGEGGDGSGEGGNGSGDRGPSAGAEERADDEREERLLPAGRPTSLGLPPRRTGVLLDPRDLRVHVGDLLRAFLGGYRVDAYGNFTFTHEGARIFVTVGLTPIGPAVGVFSITNVDVPLSLELATFLLTTNHQMGFGAFSYETEASAVWLRHSLLGTTLDGPELQAAVMSVASTAAHVDGPIQRRFGGRVFSEAPKEEQDRASPPAPEESYPSAGGYL